MRKLGFIDRVFLASTILGHSVGYSAIYLFHIALIPSIVKLLLKFNISNAWRSGIRFDILFLIVFLFWYIITLLWTPSFSDGVKYCIYIMLGISAVWVVVGICATEGRLAQAIKVLGFVTLLDIGLALVEAMGIFRAPFSPFSPQVVWFGRSPSDLSDFGELAVEYVLRLPTAFHWNPNNLSAFMVLIVPFFLLHHKLAMRLIGITAIPFVIYMAGSRVAMIAYGIALLLTVVLYANAWVKLATTILIITFGSIGLGRILGGLADSDDARVAEVGNLLSLITTFFEAFESNSSFGPSSVQARANLIMNAWDAFVSTHGVGLGAAGSMSAQITGTHFVGDLLSLHNFWLELFFEGGLVFGLLFVVWYTSMLIRLYRISKRDKSITLKYVSSSLVVALSAYIIGAIGSSSVVYALPMWLAFGIALSTINLCQVKIR